MAQVLKAAVRARIAEAALRCFAQDGYDRTSMAGVAAAAGTAPANVYRYFASKQALFDAVVPAELAVRHDALLDTRVAALAERTPGSTAAAELLDFWLDHRLAVVVLLDRADGTPFAGYPASFVGRLVEHTERAIGGDLPAQHRFLLDLVFDGTRRALSRILAAGEDREQLRSLVEGFWSYQLPGLDGLLAHLRADVERTRQPG